jgi:hypothetical protein
VFEQTDTLEGKKYMSSIESPVLWRRLFWYERASLSYEPAASIDRVQELFFLLIVAVYQNTRHHFSEKYNPNIYSYYILKYRYRQPSGQSRGSAATG